MQSGEVQTVKRLHFMSWPQAAKALQCPGSTVVWPFGAMEQHGPQLPLATDALFAERILDAVLGELAQDLPIWSLPPQAIGFSPEHRGFPGTVSLSAELLIGLIKQVGGQLAEQGVKRLVLFNAHGGQIALLQAAARQCRLRAPQLAVLPCFLWSGVSGLDQWLSPAELERGLHAGQAETSLMLHLHPELVGDARPRDGDHGGDTPGSPPEGWSLEGAAPCAWLTSDLSSTGVIGDASGASAEIGAGLEQRLVQLWRDRFEVLLNSTWPPVNPVPGAPSP